MVSGVFLGLFFNLFFLIFFQLHVLFHQFRFIVLLIHCLVEIDFLLQLRKDHIYDLITLFTTSIYSFKLGVSLKDAYRLGFVDRTQNLCVKRPSRCTLPCILYIISYQYYLNLGFWY